MGLFEKIKQRLKLNKETSEQDFNGDFGYILDDVESLEFLKSLFSEISEQFQKIYDCHDEIEKLKKIGHRHFILDEVENKILELIELDTEVLSFIPDYTDENIGMQACKCGLEKLVLRCLDDEHCSTEQNSKGLNIGMLAAENKLENAVLKALDNPEASLQKNYVGENMGMIAARNGLEKAATKALENPEASIQQDYLGENIGMKAVAGGLKSVVKIALQNPVVSTQQDSVGWNIGMSCAIRDYEDLVMIALDNEVAAVQKNRMGGTIAYFSAIRGLENAVIKSMKNEKVLYDELNDRSENIVMQSAILGLEKATIEGLKYPKIGTMQNVDGKNVIMLAAQSRLKNAVLFGLDDSLARKQKDVSRQGVIDLLYRFSEKDRNEIIDRYYELEKQEILNKKVKETFELAQAIENQVVETQTQESDLADENNDTLFDDKMEKDNGVMSDEAIAEI